MIIEGRNPYWLVQIHHAAANTVAGPTRRSNSRPLIRFRVQVKSRYRPTKPQTSYRSVEEARNAMAANVREVFEANGRRSTKSTPQKVARSARASGVAKLEITMSAGFSTNKMAASPAVNRPRGRARR